MEERTEYRVESASERLRHERTRTMLANDKRARQRVIAQFPIVVGTLARDMALMIGVEDDGFKRTITGDDLEADASIGMWLYASEAIASADLQILLTDDGGARNFDIGAIPATTWTWLEVDISSLAAGTGDVVTEFGITLTAQGEAALSGFSLYLDQAWKWAVADEEALGAAVLQDGVLSVQSVLTATAAVHTVTDLVEGTDYITHYESGSDFIVWVTDQSARGAIALVAY